MSNTYSQVYVHYVIAVKGRQNLLQKPWRDSVFKYMSTVITSRGQKAIIINGVEDHVHLFVGLNPSMRISDLIRDVKNNTSNFINDQRFIKGKFAWQKGYGVFSYAHSQVKNVYRYIANQEQHHAAQSFQKEYHEFLRKFEVEYHERFLFDSPCNDRS